MLGIEYGRDVDCGERPGLPEYRSRDCLKQSGIGPPRSSEDRRAGSDRSERRRLDDVLPVEPRARLGHGIRSIRGSRRRRGRPPRPACRPNSRPTARSSEPPADGRVRRASCRRSDRTASGRRTFPDRRAGHGIEQMGSVADRSGEGELVDVPEPGLADQGAAGNAVATRLQADEPAAGAGTRSDSRAVVAVRQRNRPGGDERLGATTGPASAAIERPRTARRPVPRRFRREVQPEYRCSGLARASRPADRNRDINS